MVGTQPMKEVKTGKIKQIIVEGPSKNIPKPKYLSRTKRLYDSDEEAWAEDKQVIKDRIEAGGNAKAYERIKTMPRDKKEVKRGQ